MTREGFAFFVKLSGVCLLCGAAGMGLGCLFQYLYS